MTTKNLAEYLADYIEREHELDDEAGERDHLDYKTILQEGLDAFESIEDVKISIHKN